MKWDEINWNKIEIRVNSIQKQIYRISLLNNKKKNLMFLQSLLISGWDAKLFAVRRVLLENKRKNLGVYGFLVLSSEKKMQLVKLLNIDGKSNFICKVSMGKVVDWEIRFLVLKDRAKQVLVLLALEPEWEAKFESNSFGFRPGRCIHDAIKAGLLSVQSFSKQNSPVKYILSTDLKKGFSFINFDYIIKKLHTLFKIEKQVFAWLKAGILDGFSLMSNWNDFFLENQVKLFKGTILVPFLINLVLHGMEIYLKEWVIKQKFICNLRWYIQGTLVNGNSLGIVRYLDNFVIIHENKELIQKLKLLILRMFKQIFKFPLKIRKIKISDLRMGFSFLGFRFIKLVYNQNYKIKIYPTKCNQKGLIKVIGDWCRSYRSISTYQLIKYLRPKILEWAYYFRYVACQQVFSRMDYQIFQILRAWVFRRDRKNGKCVVKERYFPSGKFYEFGGRWYQNNWILFGKQGSSKGIFEESWLPRMSWIRSCNYIKVNGSKSVYDGDEDYWRQRGSTYLYYRKKGSL